MKLGDGKLKTESNVKDVEYTLAVTRRFKEIFNHLHGEGSSEGLAFSLSEMEDYIENYEWIKSDEGQKELKKFNDLLEKIERAERIQR
jgi:hypothetical protein